MLLHFIPARECLQRASLGLSYAELCRKFYKSMKACAAAKSAPIACKIHALLICSGLDSVVFLQNHLLLTYSNCGLIGDACLIFHRIEFPNVYSWNSMIIGLSNAGQLDKAEELFDQMPLRDFVSWNSMMAAYFHHGRPLDSIKLLVSMTWDCNFVRTHLPFTLAMKACASLGYLNLAIQLHGFVQKFEFVNCLRVEASLLDMYIHCSAENLAEKVFFRIINPDLFCWNSMIHAYSKLYGAEAALNLFIQMPNRDTVSWSTVISILSRHGFSIQALECFVEMWNQGFRTNSRTCTSALSACASTGHLEWGTHLHAWMIRTEPILDAFLGGGLIDMYAKCGCLEYARRVFDGLVEHNTMSWTSLIGGVALSGLEEEALSLFKQMREFNVAPDEFTLTTVLGVCADKKDVFLCGQLHAYTVKRGMDSTSVPVGNALVTAYVKCGSTRMASLVFNFMPVRNVISWTTMMSAFSQAGDVEKARCFFNKMTFRNVVTWNSMLTAYTQHGLWEEGFKLYIWMLQEGVQPDWVTLATSITACADSTALKLGNQMTAQARKVGLDSNVSVANSVVTMYSKCGRIVEARKVFDSISEKDLVSWNGMMAGYAQNGMGRETIEVFESMSVMGCMPDHASYLSVLSGCSHSGLVFEGKCYFNSMANHHGISPAYEHYACMVDLLSRAGMFGQAMNVMSGMPFKPDATLWVTLLGACQTHGEAGLAEFVGKNLMEFNFTEGPESYTLLANIYLNSGRPESAAAIRGLMQRKGVRMNRGCSWIECP